MSLFAGIAGPAQNLAAADASKGSRLRSADADRKRQQRAQSTVIVIPKCANKRRRNRLEKDDEAWLRWYFGAGCGLADDNVYSYPFTEQQQEIIRIIRRAIMFGEDQAIAASRGEGKTTSTQRMLLKCALSGEVKFSTFFTANGEKADDSLEEMRMSITDNTRLRDDYPEVCIPIIELEGIAQRAKTQRANGFRHDNSKPFEMAELNYAWCGREIVFPNVPGAPGAGAIITAAGLDSATRGAKKRGKRPRIAIIDDPDTEDTARSQEQAKKLETRIDNAIGGLGGQKRTVGRVILTTLQSRTAVSFRFTDPKQKPSMKGRRYRFLIMPPNRMDLWEEYIVLRQVGQAARDESENDSDPFARNAHRFYVEHRAAMDAGAIVSNPNRFDDTPLPDGTPKEISALQHYFNQVADKGKDFVSTEYDNDPPEGDALLENGLQPIEIQTQVSGLDRGIIPEGTFILTQGIDVRKVALHWVVRAWTVNAAGLLAGYTIDYGVQEVYGTVFGSDVGVDTAITSAILERYAKTKTATFKTAAGQTMPVSLSLCDAGWKTDAVYAACLKAGPGLMPVMGFGKSNGCTQANFRAVMEATTNRQPGDGWFLSKQQNGIWLVCAEADRWKAWEHDRWLTAADSPGALLMFGQPSAIEGRLSEDEKAHFTYARHICNEIEVERVIRGVLRRVWEAKSKESHWLDASYYADVAANMRGVRLGTSSAGVRNAQPRRQRQIKAQYINI